MSNRRRSVFEVSHINQQQIKQQEESLSYEIDQNLRTLALLFPIHDDAKHLLVKNAFLKQNRPAFLHVFHYLVPLISNDFRKRFRWPITSTAEETDFRNSALTYINQCQSVNKWDFGPFKMAVLMFPGGIEFMKIIVELTKIAMRKILKDSDALHLIDSNGISIREARAKLQAAEHSYEEMEKFCSKVNELAGPLKIRIRRMEYFRKIIIDNTSIKSDNFSALLCAWEKKQDEVINIHVWPMIQQLEDFLSKCAYFEQQITDSKAQQLKYNEDQMGALGLLQSDHSDHQLDVEGLINFIQTAMPDIIHATHFKPPWSLEKLRKEHRLLGKLLHRIHSLMNKLEMVRINFPTVLNSTGENRSCDSGARGKLNHWSDKLMLTPQMKCPMTKDRIAIWEAVPAMDSPARNIPSTSGRADDTLRVSVEMDSGWMDTISKKMASTKLDPMALLSNARHRNKGLNKSKGSPSKVRNAFVTSPSRNNNTNTSPFHSTMIQKEDQVKSPGSTENQKTTSGPSRKNLF